MSILKEDIAEGYRKLQDEICNGLEELDQNKFEQDLWERPEGGGGRTRIIADGDVIVKGGVNFSEVYGPTPDKILTALKLENADFFATGVSIVIHPKSPMVPIIHMNVRYFEMSNGVHWFGGGIDLTPHYVDRTLARLFHQKLKSTCDKHHPDYYQKFKDWADDYFYIRHRKETRGIGGIFYDHLSANETMSKEDLFQFSLDVGRTFVPAYAEQVELTRNLPFGERELEWQKLRRGRYVEFNLVLDKGTKFGLDTDGRTESILMSLPPLAGWEYNYSPEPGSKEEQTLQMLVKGYDWIS